MAKIQIPVTAYSYSRWSDHDKCPEYFKHKYIDKIPDQREPKPGEEGKESALDRGSRIHKDGENYVKNRVVELPETLIKWAPQFAELRAQDFSGEEDWAFDENWHQVEYFSKQVRVRIKTDAHRIFPDLKLGRVIDYKTGRLKDRGFEPQMDLYALGMFAKYRGLIETVEVELWFLDHDPSETGMLNPLKNKYGLWQANSIDDAWDRRTAAMLKDTRFEPNPGYACRFCPYKQGEGGQCQY